jgi:hypothetical protein
MNAKPAKPKVRLSKGAYLSDMPGGNRGLATCNLDDVQAAAFHAAYNSQEAVDYRQRLLADERFFTDGNAANLMSMSDILISMEDWHSGKPSRFGGATPPPKERPGILKGRSLFYRQIGKELHQWIKARDFTSFRKLADLMEKMPDCSMERIASFGSDYELSFLQRALKKRPTLPLVIWYNFNRLTQVLRKDLKAKAGEFDEWFGVPTKAELQSKVLIEWEKLGKVFDERTYRLELKRLGLSGLPRAAPIKKSVKRGK